MQGSNNKAKPARSKASRKLRVEAQALGELISQADAAKLRQVTRAAIGYLVSTGRLNSREVFGRRLVYKSEVLSFQPGQPGPKRNSAVAGGKSRRGGAKK